MRLWYRQPAAKWEEALPLGNGRMGAMVFGGTSAERLQLNEDSIWSGGPRDRVNPDAIKNLDEIRRMIREGKIDQAERLSLLALPGMPNSERSYQPAGDLLIEFPDIKGAPSDYVRELDLEEGMVKISAQIGELRCRREAFASCPDGVIVYRLEALEGGKLELDLHLERGYNLADQVRTENGDSVCMSVDGGKGISFSVYAGVRQEGGRTETIGEHVLVRGADTATIYLSVATSFRFADHEGEARSKVRFAAEKGYAQLREAHVRDYQSLYRRLSLALGEPEMDEIPTDVRLKRLREGVKDPGLFALHFQYGRYLLIASSRPGSLPANLQGIWNESMDPSWGSKYTININLEMNYWIAESGNLSECHLPFFDLLERVMENGRDTARRMYGCRGSVAHHNTDIHADTAPQDACISATFWVMGEAWMATHIWEHYLYTGDRRFLEAYCEVQEECLKFFEDFLIPMEAEGRTFLVTSPSISPENTYILPDGTRGCMCEGPAMDMQILRELLLGYIKTCRVLGREESGIQRAQRLLDQLPEPAVGQYGQIQEWAKDYEEAEPGHRHISQLYAIYPGTGLTWKDTPGWMEAGRKTLERRLSYGGGHTGWSRAWIIGLWARLYEGEKAEENYAALLSGSTFPNLFDNHPLGDGHIFQIDGNFGASAALLEMLVQSHGGRIVFLPAVGELLSEGAVSGVRLREGITLSMEWKDRRLVRAVLLPDHDCRVIAAVNGEERELSLIGAEAYVIRGE